jgi:hypothetical protein
LSGRSGPILWSGGFSSPAPLKEDDATKKPREKRLSIDETRRLTD